MIGSIQKCSGLILDVHQSIGLTLLHFINIYSILDELCLNKVKDVVARHALIDYMP
jgi:hypothetical protein